MVGYFSSRRSGLPFDHLLNDRIGHLGNQCGRDVCPVHLLEGADDLAGGHALRIQEQEFVIHGGEAALVLLHQLRLKATSAIAGTRRDRPHSSCFCQPPERLPAVLSCSYATYPHPSPGLIIGSYTDLVTVPDCNPGNWNSGCSIHTSFDAQMPSLCLMAS
jgi:hypothetical protein